MNYLRIYSRIIGNRLITPADEYTERHHIVPRSIGGSESKDNMVLLTAREHFVCHWLLVKMYKQDTRTYHKMLKAFNMMCNSVSENQDRYVACSRVFARYREDLSKAMSALQSGENNSQAGTMWICDLTTRENKKVPKGNIPNGWVVGRNKWKSNKPKTRKELRTRIRKYLNGYAVSVDGIEYDSISHAADSLGIGHETARMRFKSENFPEYVILPR